MKLSTSIWEQRVKLLRSPPPLRSEASRCFPRASRLAREAGSSLRQNAEHKGLRQRSFYRPRAQKLSAWRQARLVLCAHRDSNGSSAEQQEESFTPVPKTAKQYSAVPGCVALIAGGTIGGGFLALPYATAPFGFAPSVVSMILCWGYLCTSALILAEVHIMSRFEKISGSAQDGGDFSINAMATESLGPVAGKALSLCFLILVQATLVAQISKGGTVISGLLGGQLPPAVCSVLLVTALAGVVFRCQARVVDITQLLLSLAMLGAFVSVIGTGMPHVQLELLARAEWTGFAGSFAVILQLLSFAEMVPTVCHRLAGDRSSIRLAIIVGSLIPLLMCVSWSSVAIGLVPWGGSGLLLDPVEAMLGWNGTSAQRAPLGPLVSSLALSAIATTIIGSLLALGGLFGDLLGVRKFSNGQAQTGQHRTTSGGMYWRGLLAETLAVLPPLALAMSGPQVYYMATEFAGAYPVTILWGLAPPLMLLGLKTKQARLRGDNLPLSDFTRSAPAAIVVGVIGAAMLSARLTADIAWFVSWFSTSLI